ncbi:MAG: DUF1311 domain-containing protein [Chitinophagaceae bacterium]|nr:MAG: DUF1311 domain-containing protein [Chitinophagaceae bacterium]
MKYLLLLFFVAPGLSATAQTQLEMNQEAADSMKIADAEMTLLYRKAVAKQDAAGRKLLLDAQRKWIRYKEAHCKAVAQAYDKGSMQPMVFCHCITELTRERADKLKRYSNEGGIY